jgi:hypothetical protein
VSFFDNVVSGIFGGTDTSAQDAASAGAAQARQDALGLFPQAQQARRQGFQGALDVLSQSIPAQLQAFQQGNVGAQNQLISGLPQFQNAILGNQADLSAFQPTTVSAPPPFTLPTLAGAQSSGSAQNPQVQAFINALSGGASNFNQGPSQGGDGGVQTPTGDGGNISTQQFGRSLAELLGQPQQTSAFGVTEISPVASLIAALVPGGSLATGAAKVANLSNIRDVQGSLGLDQSSMLNVLNPFSKLASGQSNASLGSGTFGNTKAEVTFGGLTSKGKTALTPQEALTRQIRVAEFERKKEAAKKREQRDSGRNRDRQRDSRSRERSEARNRERGTGSREGVAGR